MKIGITPSSFAESDKMPIDFLSKHNIDIVENPYKRRLTEDEAFEFIEDLDGLIAGLEPLTRKVLTNGKKLRAIARVGIGMDNIDFDAVKDLGIKVSNTPDGPTNSVAEMTVTALLSIRKNIIPLSNDVHQGIWKKRIGRDLAGKKVLFIGFGRIGRKTASFMQGFGPEIYVYDPYLKEKIPSIQHMTSLGEALSCADVISFHASGTTPIITMKELPFIKKGAILLNSARGELIEETVVKKGLDEGYFSAAWFDAFWKEPYNGVLSSYDNVVLTPHSGTYTEECMLSMELNAAENVLRDLGIC